MIKNCNLNNCYRAISLDHSNNNKIENSEFSSNSDGVYLYYSDYNIVEESDFNSNYRGVYIERYSDHNEIKNNTMTSNDLGVFTSSNNADYNVILYNSITDSTNRGVYISSDYNDISENYFNNPSSDLYLHTQAEYNKVTGNDFYGAGVTGEGSFTDFCSGNSNYYAPGAARPDAEDLCGCVDNDGDGTYVYDSVGCPQGNDCDDNDKYIIGIVDDLHVNYSVIVCTGDYTIVDRAGDGIIFIDADNITFDCNNARILPATWGSGIILSYKNNIVIKNCNLENYYRSISLDHSHNNRIENSEFSSNSDGVYLYYSDYNIVEESDFNSNYRGVYIERYSDHNEIKNNTMTSNDFGVFTSSNNADYNSIIGNSITSSTDYGAYISSDNNDISENYFNNPDSDLYLTNSAEYNKVTGNDFYGAGVTGEGSFTDFCSGNSNYYAPGAARPAGEDGCGYFTISLTQGWNLISMPINLTNKILPKSLESIEGKYSKVMAYDSEWKVYDPNDLAHSNLNSIDEKMGLWIKMTNADVLEVNGLKINSPVIFNLKEGYNLIGYPSLNESNVSFVFGNVNDDLVNVLTYENGEWKGYNPLKVDELNSLKIIKPGFGYWVRVNKDVSWIFNRSSMSRLELLPVNITIIFPENKTYYTNSRKISLAVETNKEADCVYSLNNAPNITLYNDATEGSTILTGVFGQNNVVVYCSDGVTSDTESVEFYIEKSPSDILLITTSVDTNKGQYLHVINILDGLGYNYDIVDDDSIEGKDLTLYKMLVVVGDGMELLDINSNEEDDIVEAINNGVDVLWIGNGIWGTDWVTLPSAFGIGYVERKSAGSYNIEKMSWTDIGGSNVKISVNSDEYVTKISLNGASAEGYFLKNNDAVVFPSITYYRKDSTTGKTVYIGFDIFDYWKQYNNNATWSRAEMFVKYLRELGSDGVVSLHPFPNAWKAVFIVRLEDLTPSGTVMNQNNPVWVNRFNNTVDLLNEKGIPLNLALISVYKDPYRGEIGYWNETGRNVPSLRSVLEKTLRLGGSIISHGYTHQNGSGSDDYSSNDYEMWDEDNSVWMTYEEQFERTNAAMDLISKEFNVTAKTWETPHYKGNDDTYLAAKNSGFIYSCESDNKIFPNPYGYEDIMNNNLLNLPETAYNFPLSPTQSFIDMNSEHILPRLERIHGSYFIFYHNSDDLQYNGLKQIVGNASKMDYWFPNIDEYGDWWVNKTSMGFESLDDTLNNLMEVNLVGMLKDVTLQFRLPDGKVLKNVTVNENLIPVKTEKINDIVYVYPVFDVLDYGNVKLYYTDPLSEAVTQISVGDTIDPINVGEKTTLWCDYEDMSNEDIVSADITFEIDGKNYSSAFVNYNKVNSRYEIEYTATDDGVVYWVCYANKDNYQANFMGSDLTVLTEEVSLNISLTQGWNLISIPVDLTNKMLPKALESIEGKYSKVVAYEANGNEWKMFDPNDLAHSNLNSIDEKMGLWIKMTNADVLEVNGSEFNTVNFNLKQGYNLIGYPSLEENNVSYVFGDVISDVENVLSYENNSWKSYNPNKNDELNSLIVIKPGHGYWVRVNKDVSWSFDGKFS